MSKTFDFTKSMYLYDWDNQSEYFRFGYNGLQLKRTRTGETNVFYGATIEEGAGTTINGVTHISDYDGSNYTIVKGTGSQEIIIDLGSGNETNIKRLALSFRKQSTSDTMGAFEVYVSEDKSDWIPMIFTFDSSDFDPIITSERSAGDYARYVKLVTQGTAGDSDTLLISDLQAYKATYPIPFKFIKNTETLAATTLTGLTASNNEPSGTEQRVIVTLEDIPKYWDGGEWIENTEDESDYDTYSNTVSDVNTNISSLLPASGGTFNVGLWVVLVPTEDLTPGITSLTITTT